MYVEELSMVESNLADLTRLSVLSRLTHLCLGGYEQHHMFSALQSLPLVRLVLADTFLESEDLSTLPTTLHELDLSHTEVDDITALSSCVHLRKLELYNTSVSEVTVLSSLHNLQHMGLGKTQVQPQDLHALLHLCPHLRIYTKGEHVLFQ